MEAVARFVERRVAAIGAVDVEYACRRHLARPIRCATARCSELKGIYNILNFNAFGPVRTLDWRVRWMGYGP